MPSTNDSPTRLEVLVGRALAICVHPFAAWRSRPTRRRAALLFACYFALGYLVTFGLLRLIAA